MWKKVFRDIMLTLKYNLLFKKQEIDKTENSYTKKSFFGKLLER